jgi:excisionase family DNA binding protein
MSSKQVVTSSAFPELMTAAQLAAYLRVPRTYISEKTRYRSLNPIPAVRLGARTLRFRMSEVQVWLQQQTGTLSKPRRYKRGPAARHAKHAS